MPFHTGCGRQGEGQLVLWWFVSLSDTVLCEHRDLPRWKFSPNHRYVKIIQISLPHVNRISPACLELPAPCSKLNLHHMHMFNSYNSSSGKKNSLVHLRLEVRDLCSDPTTLAFTKQHILLFRHRDDGKQKASPLLSQKRDFWTELLRIIFRSSTVASPACFSCA